MPMTPRLQQALERIEARRVALEREIVAEIEARFFVLPEPEIEDVTVHLGAPDPTIDESSTYGTSPFETVWYA